MGKISHGSNWRHVNILNPFSRLKFCVDLCCSGGWGREVSPGEQEVRCWYSPAAAAGSIDADRFSLASGLRGSLPNGLLLRFESVCREEGERDRLSNLDDLRGSGSVWSKRERFTLRSSSPMLRADI